MALQVYPILTSFRIVDPEEELQHLFDAGQDLFLSRVNYMTSSTVTDMLLSGLDIPVLMIQTVDPEELIARAKENMMVNIGTRICLLSETIEDPWWGTVHHSVGIVRCPKPHLWKIVDVCWSAQDRCPLSM
jgi:hypothetical protein